MTEIKLFGQFYNEATSLRSVILSVPVIGTYLDLYLSDKGQQFAQERIDYLLENLSCEMGEIKEHLLSKTILNSEEGYDLVQKSFIAAARTRQKEKLILFAKILRGAFTIKNFEHDPEMYIKIVDELSERELAIAFLLYNEKEKLKIDPSSAGKTEQGNDAYWLSKINPIYSRDEIEYTLPRIEKTGLIKELVGTFIGYVGGEYNPTKLFSDFMKFVENNE